MARIKGPLHCEQGSGKMSNSIIFRKLRGVKFASRFYYPNSKTKKNPTETQTEIREKYKRAIEEWNKLTEEEKQEYSILSRSKKYSGYNLFVKNYLLYPPYAVLGELFLGYALLGNEE